MASAGALSLTGLTPATAYTYTMYDAADCETDVAQISFTTTALPSGVTLGVTALLNDRVTLAPAGWDQSWYYTKQQDGSTVGSCSGPVGPGAATITTVLLPTSATASRRTPTPAAAPRASSPRRRSPFPS